MFRLAWMLESDAAAGSGLLPLSALTDMILEAGLHQPLGLTAEHVLFYVEAEIEQILCQMGSVCGADRAGRESTAVSPGVFRVFFESLPKFLQEKLFLDSKPAHVRRSCHQTRCHPYQHASPRLRHAQSCILMPP